MNYYLLVCTELVPEATVAAQRGGQKNKSKNNCYSASDNMVRERPLKSPKLTASTHKTPFCRLTQSYFISLKDSDLGVIYYTQRAYIVVMKGQNLLRRLGVGPLSSSRFGGRSTEENFKWPPQRVVVVG